MKKMYKVIKEDISITLNDFSKFCQFIDEKKPVLSSQKIVLGKNDLFELNALLHFQKDVSATHYQQYSYPVIDLFFHLALLGKLYVKSAGPKGKIYLAGTTRKDEFDRLNIFEKYVFLFEFFWCRFDFEDILSFGRNAIDNVVQTMAGTTPGTKLGKGAFSKRKDWDPVFSYSSVIIDYFKSFGWCNYLPVIEREKKIGKYDDSIIAVIPTELGVNICKILAAHEITKWNIPWLNEFGFYDKDAIQDYGIIPLTKIIGPLFPKDALKNSVKSVIKIVKGSYVFKVSLARNLWRKIELSHKHTLLDLHNSIQNAFNFDDDHLYSFFMDGKRRSKDKYNSPDSGGGPYVDDVTIGDLELYNGQRFLYLFDYGFSWEFDVQLERINPDGALPAKPKIIEVKGKDPEQYEY